jgi:hypothetical protein
MSATMSGVRAGTLEAPTVHVEVEAPAPADHESSRRRFTIAACIALGVAFIPYLWVLWNGWFDPLRTAWPTGSFSNFYDLQARALMHGHWDVPKGKLGIEAFVVDGRHYIFFGPFPAFLRMPVLAVTSSLDGRLTAPSLLLSWFVTAIFSALLLWRVRILLRGPAVLGRAEAAAMGVLLAMIASGSVLVHLASLPWVYHEDFAWGAALAIAALFALLGVLERPSTGRVVATGVLILLTLLTRLSLGWGCAIAAILAAIWFASGRGGEEARRWWLPVLGAALLPVAVGVAVNFVKFGIPFGADMNTQVFTKINAHRRQVLAANGGRLWTPSFVPSTAWAYFRPDGLRLTAVFPFITLPANPARGVGGQVLDQTYRTASLTAAMPLLFLLGVWGTITAFRPRPTGRSKVIRIPLVGAAIATAAVLMWGYISYRYTTEFVPFFVLAAAVGLVDLWRRAGVHSRFIRISALTAVAIVALFSVAANLLIVSSPTDPVAWHGDRVRSYVELQKSLSDKMGHPIDGNIVQGSRLPKRAPADTLFVLGDCAGLYISTGEFEHNWIPVEYGGKGATRIAVVFNRQPDRGRFLLASVRKNQSSNVYIDTDGAGRMRFRIDDRYGLPNFISTDHSHWTRIRTGKTYQITVVADSELHRYAVSLDDAEMVNGVIATSDRLVVPWLQRGEPGKPGAPVTVTEGREPSSTLCDHLLASKRG